MKRRNQLLALLCLLVFAGLGVLYFRYWVVQKPFGIVLFIGEGLTPARLAAARVYAGGAATSLTLDAMPNAALLTNYSDDFATPDSAAAARAIAIGVKVKNGTFVSPDGKETTTLFELARAAGRATGLVTDGKLTDATSAAFYAREAQPNESETIARELTERARIDVLLGGGGAEFVAKEKGGARIDRRDLLLEARRGGAEVVRSKAELNAVPAWRRPKLLGVFAEGEISRADQLEAHSTQPTLPEMVRRAIELLQYNRAGYLLVVDAALMRSAAQANDGEHTLTETIELDRAVAVAQRYVGERSTVIVSGDVAVGGMAVNGAPFRNDRGIAVLGLNSAGDPWITWASGPNGVASFGAARMNAKPTSADTQAHPPQEPAAFYNETALKTVDDVIAFGSGAGTASLHGTLDNTAIFRVVRDQL